MRPLLKTLVDLYDAASLAGRELQRVQESVSAALRPIEEVAVEDMKENDEPDWRPPAAVRPPWWALLAGGAGRRGVVRGVEGGVGRPPPARARGAAGAVAGRAERERSARRWRPRPRALR